MFKSHKTGSQLNLPALQEMETRLLLSGNLLVNGSFELPNNTYISAPFDTVVPFDSPQVVRRWGNLALGLTDWMRLTAGQGPANTDNSYPQDNNDNLDYRALAGWTVFGSIDWKSGDALGAGRGYWRAEDGNLSVDLNATGPGGLAQTITTKVGASYTVSLWLSGNPFGGGTAANAGIRSVEVAVGNGSVGAVSTTPGATTFTDPLGADAYQTFSFRTNDPNGDNNTSDALTDYSNGHPILNMQYQEHEFTFTAKSTSTLILFHSLVASGVAGPVLDNVSVFENIGVPPPAIDIVKLTNGTNNDNAPVAGVPDGPVVKVGDTVTWTYNVTNPGEEPIGNVQVTDSVAGVTPAAVLSGGFNTGDSNHNSLLDPGETWVFTASGTAVAGQYSNIGTATGAGTLNNTPVTASNPDHYFGANPLISILKLTNGTNNDSTPVAGVPDGPVVNIGDTVTWTYNVTNPGNEQIGNVKVTDNVAGVTPAAVLSGGFNTGDSNHNSLLDPGETWVFTASGTAVAGQYSNIGTATGASALTNTPLTASNPDHYFAVGCPSPTGDVVVDQNVLVNFQTVTFDAGGNLLTGPTYTGDPDLAPYFSYVVSKALPVEQWKAVFDVGTNRLDIMDEATLTVSTFGSGNNQASPGIDIKALQLTVQADINNDGDGGGTILVSSLNQPAGGITIETTGQTTINGTILDQVVGTNGTPGPIVIQMAGLCGNIDVGPTGRIETYGVDHGGSNITLVAGDPNGPPIPLTKGNITILGLVQSSYKGGHASTINIVSFPGTVTIDGNNLFGFVPGTKTPITSGVHVWSRRDPLPGTVNIQANGDITVNGNTLLDWRNPNTGAVSVKTSSSNAIGGVINAVSLNGKIVATDRAFDGVNLFNTPSVAKITLKAFGNIDLRASGRTNSVSSGSPTLMPVVNIRATGSGGVGGTNRLRSYNGVISIGTDALVWAGPSGKNLLMNGNTPVVGATAGVSPNPTNPPAGDSILASLTPLFADLAALGL